MNKKNKSLIPLIWVVFTDSLGWGIAFSVFAALFFNEHSDFLPASISDSSRYMLYEFTLAIYSVFMFLFAPVLGGIADHYGRKPGLIISLIGLTAGFLLSTLGCYYGLFSLLIVGRVISGITAGSLSIAQAAVVDISTPETKSFNLSIVMLANCLGFSLGPVLGGIFIQMNAAPIGTMTFVIASLMSAAGLLGIYFFFDETYAVNNAAKKLNLWKDFANIKIAFCKPILNGYLASLLFSMLAFGLFYSNIPVFLSREFAANSSVTGMILSTGAVVFSAALMFSGKYVYGFFDKKRIVLITLIIQILAYLALSFCVHELVLNIAYFMLISAFTGVMYIGLLTLISDVTESNWQGRVMGVVASLSSVTWGGGPLLAGWLNQYGKNTVFLCCILLVTIGLLILRYSQQAQKTEAILDVE